MIRAFLFDLDGTLVDSLGDIAGAMNETLVAHGLAPHPLADYRRFVGEGVVNLVARAVPEDRQALRDAILAEYRLKYADRMLRDTRPYDGVRALLDELRRRGFKLAVLSNKPDLPTNRIVQHFFPRTFDLIYGERMGMPRKPEPQAALEICAALGSRPDFTAFVGDTKIDMETAAKAGMLPVGVTWGFRDEAELRQHGAAFILHHPSELVPTVLGTR